MPFIPLGIIVVQTWRKSKGEYIFKDVTCQVSTKAIVVAFTGGFKENIARESEREKKNEYF